MPLKIASLGSSFAAGCSIPPRSGPRSAGRSKSNYAHLVSKKLSASLTDLTVSGATLKTISTEPQRIPRGDTFPPQIEGLKGDEDVVTITAGGNDIGYVGGLMLDSSRNNSYLGWAIASAYSYFSAERVQMNEDELKDTYVSVLDAIHVRAPKAKVYVVEYLALLGTDVKTTDVPLSEEQIAFHRGVGEMLQRATRRAALERGQWCECIPVHEKSLGHGIGSKQPWVEGYGLALLLRWVASYHPNAAGHVAVADMLYERLKR